jgi:exopolysaccharide production protein ExoZ
MLRSIALLRGLSALFVAIFHATYYEGQSLHGSPLAFEPIANRLSLAGVTTFFCLSGYLIARLVEVQPFGRFATRRVLRIYPAFLAATGIAYFGARISLNPQPDFPLIALTLLPVGEVHRPLGVEWTLVYEVFYYAVASLFCFGATRRFFSGAILVWTGIVLTAFLGFSYYGTSFHPTIEQILFSGFNLGFLAGALGRHAERRKWARPYWILPGIFLIGICEVWGIAMRGILLPAGLGFFVVGIIVWEKQRGGFRMPRWVLQLGDASYGIYLLHVPIILGLLTHIPRNWNLPAGSVSVIAIALVLLVTIPFGLAEHGFYSRTTRLLSPRSGR